MTVIAGLAERRFRTGRRKVPQQCMVIHVELHLEYGRCRAEADNDFHGVVCGPGSRQ